MTIFESHAVTSCMCCWCRSIITCLLAPLTWKWWQNYWNQMPQLHSVSCHHGDHGEPGRWIDSNKLVCEQISTSSATITCEPESRVKWVPTISVANVQRHKNATTKKRIAFFHPPCWSPSMYCTTSIHSKIPNQSLAPSATTEWDNMGWNINMRSFFCLSRIKNIVEFHDCLSCLKTMSQQLRTTILTTSKWHANSRKKLTSSYSDSMKCL